MPAIFVILIAVFATTLSVTLALSASGHTRPTARGTGFAMLVGGLGLVALGAVSLLVTGEALALATAALGLIAIGFGAQRLRAAR